MLYAVVSFGIFFFLLNNAAQNEAGCLDHEENCGALIYSDSDWVLAVGISILWLPAIVVLLMYGVLYTVYRKMVIRYRDQAKEENEREEED